MKKLLMLLSFPCLAAAGIGIVLCGDWRIAFAYPAVLGVVLIRDTWMVAKRTPAVNNPVVLFLDHPRFRFALQVFFLFTLFLFAGSAIDHFTRMPGTGGWVKACAYAGLVLQPGFWRTEDAEGKRTAAGAVAAAVAAAAAAAVWPAFIRDFATGAAFALAAGAVAVRLIAGRKEGRS